MVWHSYATAEIGDAGYAAASMRRRAEGAITSSRGRQSATSSAVWSALASAMASSPSRHTRVALSVVSIWNALMAVASVGSQVSPRTADTGLPASSSR